MPRFDCFVWEDRLSHTISVEVLHVTSSGLAADLELRDTAFGRQFRPPGRRASAGDHVVHSFLYLHFVLYFAVVLETKSLIAVGLGMLVVVGVIVLTVVCVFRLALSIYSTATAITVGILTLIPYLGILILLIINSKATKILRTNGIKVGLMGDKVKQIPMT